MLTLRPMSDDPPIPACPLCKPDARHPLCDLYSHFEWMAQHDQEWVTKGATRASVEAFRKGRTS